ncbi:Polysaccharide biosynthesis protein [Geobacillus sp. BCO2]|nr:Polysaccharide biosynthesis protein [Geobacillus sp. BCO2]
MFSAFKRLGADSLLYAFMNVGTKLIAFLMLPIYTSYLSKAQYGAVYLIDQWTSMLTFLVIFGTDSALSFYYYDTDDKEKRLLYVRNVMYFRLFVVGLLFLAVVLAGPWIAGALFQEPRYVDLLYISIATLLLDTIFVMATTVLRFEFQTKKVVIWTLVKMLLVAVLSYAALRWFAATPEGLLIGRLVSSALVFLLMLHLTVKYMVWRVRFDVLKELLAYAAPLVPTSLAFWVIANVSTFFIQRFASLEEVGVFGVALRLATVITLITSGVQMAWRPYSMSMKDRSESRALFAKVYMALLLIGAFGLLLIATASPWLVATFFKPEYRDAASYIPFLSAVTFLNFYYLIVSTGLFLTKETGYISRGVHAGGASSPCVERRVGAALAQLGGDCGQPHDVYGRCGFHFSQKPASVSCASVVEKNGFGFERNIARPHRHRLRSAGAVCGRLGARWVGLVCRHALCQPG